MQQRIPHKPNYYLLLILMFIFGDVVCENYIFRSYNSFVSKVELCFFIGTLLLQALASPIQAAFSDLFCRKRSIIISLSSSFLSLLLLLLFNSKTLAILPLVVVLSFIKGAFGNTIPLSLAAIADTQDKNYRVSFGFTTLSYTLAFVLMIFTTLYLSDLISNVIAASYYVIILFLSVFSFVDIRDRSFHHSSVIEHDSVYKLLKKELGLVITELRKSSLQYGIIAFFLWEISIYSVLLLYVDFNVDTFRFIAMTMMLGYATGIFVLKIFNNTTDLNMCKFGYLLGSLSLLPFYSHLIFSEAPSLTLLAVCYYFHSIGLAVLPPTLFAMLAKVTKPHEQGRIYGIIESVDTIAFLVSSLAVLISGINKLPLIYIVSLSFVTIVFSWFPFRMYDKLRSKELV